MKSTTLMLAIGVKDVNDHGSQNYNADILAIM
jgi:hypothetical protein